MNPRWLAALALLPLSMGAANPHGARGARDDLVFEGGENGIAITKLIETAVDVTNEPFFFDPKELKDEKVHFTGRVMVPRERFLPFFDHCLREEDFLHLEWNVAGQTVHSIRKLGQQMRGQAVKQQARTVTTEELKALADRQILVTTTYVVQNLPARELVTTLQLYFADSVTESIRNVDGTNAIIMTGFAANVAGLVAMADRLDTGLANDPEFGRRRDLEARVAKLEETLAKLQGTSAKPAK
jgi:type II secretory pathway component GspD/PulD (secretin)